MVAVGTRFKAFGLRKIAQTVDAKGLNPIVNNVRSAVLDVFARIRVCPTKVQRRIFPTTCRCDERGVAYSNKLGDLM